MVIRKNRNYKGFIVEIRPPKWKKKIWIGKLETLELAQYVSDALYHYLGKPPLYFEEGVMTLPAITCVGTVIGTPVKLTTQEMCANYVSIIAKGQQFEPQRDDFILRVKDVVTHPGFPFLASPHRDSKASTDESVPPPVPMAPMSKPKFSTDSSGGSPGGSSGTAWRRYKGVSQRANTWEAEIRVPKGNKGNEGNKIWLGTYPTPLEAAVAYDVAVTCLGGGESRLNFQHPIYKQIPRVLPDLSRLGFITECREVVKEFLELAKETGNSGWLDQEVTLGISLARKLAQDKDTLFNSSMQQEGDLSTCQENKRRRLSDISFSELDFPEKNFNNETIGVLPKPDVELVEMLPPYLSTSAPDVLSAWPTIELVNTRNKQPYQPISFGHDMLSRSPALKFTMADLNIITRNFSESHTIWQEGSRSVYRGQLKDGTMVAIKRIKKDDKNVLGIEDAKDFQTEDHTLCEEHLNLVRVLGFLEDENEHILVTNGNLRQHLDGVPYGVILDISKRCRISLDVLGALKHLHNQNKDDLDIIHRDIKSSDILITDDFHAKVVGFGLSRRSSFGDVGASSSSIQVKRTSGYMAHEHSTTHHLKEQNDLYLFGELLIEIFTGKRVVESNPPRDECFTPRWVLKQCAEGRLMDIIDPNITPTTFDLKTLEQIFKLAASCLVLEESNRPTVEGVFGALSIIVGHYSIGHLLDESNSSGDKYEVQEEQKWDPKVYIEPNLQTLCLEESEALERQELTKHLDKVDLSNPSFMPTKPPSSLFVEDLESSKVQTSTQLGTQLEVDSKQATRRASEVLIAKQDQSSPLFTNIISDVFPLKSDETYFEMLQEEIAKLGYISRLLSEGDGFEQNLTNIGKTSFFLYFNEKDNVFEFYFKNYQGMASIVGVGLECAKVVLEDGWRVTVQEISKPNWDDAWKNFDSS